MQKIFELTSLQKDWKKFDPDPDQNRLDTQLLPVRKLPK
jgi:hypothetical protein